jgi:hypothetical protein
VFRPLREKDLAIKKGAKELITIAANTIANFALAIFYARSLPASQRIIVGFVSGV